MAVARLSDWCVKQALPLWIVAGFDADSGHFLEGLQTDATPETTGVLRTRTAARQIYVFAHAHALGVAPEGALEKAERAFQSLLDVAWVAGEKPGFARTFNRSTGEITDSGRDLYDHACVLLALAWLFKATGNSIYRTHVDRTLSAIDTTLRAAHGGWAEDDAGVIPRRQNPHMHFFEACLALAENTGDGRYLARAGEMFGLFRTQFFDVETGLLTEHFGAAWEKGETYGSHRFEPGHMAEWVWLVRRHARLADCDADRICFSLLTRALAIGQKPGDVFLADEASADGEPLKNSRRLWPQAELLKAYLMQYRALGEQSMLDAADTLTDALFETYLAHETPGGWRDCFDLDGNFIAKTMPASSLYHVFTGVAELYAKP
ncbi:AGE family epimerase/isomerase [Rhizobium sp. CFBP 8762]|uniref:AGE family epimerase/isomerase n=1 Tax=Rhizobium sp. CFBP 8762 TaxID=2775279 RepID=UPI0017801B72|nr:AGE family epimerase/isomerase [Rhizobium sp. CFBP 8762]MBD8555629.1 AGE family epimerase/isomerase [Rhizobium sp. CFBP 8762]